jgi:hypothetical protein
MAIETKANAKVATVLKESLIVFLTRLEPDNRNGAQDKPIVP